MKKFKSLYIRGLLALTILGAASCSIEEYNPSGVTPDAIWSTPEGMATAVNGAYHEVRYWYGKEDGMLMSEAGTDIWFNKGYVAQLSQYVGLSSGTNYIKSTWKSLYAGVNLCNGALDRIDNVVYPTPAERQQAEGQLRFLRAFYYWHIVETWGGVNLKLHETANAGLTAKRSSVEAFYDVIISDLKIAVEYLPISWNLNYGRASKKSAMGMLARVYLSRAYYGDGPTYFALARDIAKQVIDQKATLKTALRSNYADLWSSAANNRANGKDNGEALFVIANSTNQTYNYDGNGNRLHAVYQNPYNDYPGLTTNVDNGLSGSTANPVLLPTLALLDMFDETKDSRYAGSFQEVWKANKAFTWSDLKNAKNNDPKDSAVYGKSLANGDTAMYVTKRVVSNKSTRRYTVYDRTTSYEPNGKFKNGTDNFVALKKFRDYNRTNATSQPGFNDAIIIRLAEMYMIAAEAEFQLGNPGIAADYINVLRTRAAIKTPVDQTAAMQVTAGEITLDFILDEYAREFAGEMRRWFDLKRTGKLTERVAALNPNISIMIDPNLYVRPISIDEMNALTNAAEFGQNQGYN